MSTHFSHFILKKKKTKVGINFFYYYFSVRCRNVCSEGDLYLCFFFFNEWNQKMKMVFRQLDLDELHLSVYNYFTYLQHESMECQKSDYLIKFHSPITENHRTIRILLPKIKCLWTWKSKKKKNVDNELDIQYCLLKIDEYFSCM